MASAATGQTNYCTKCGKPLDPGAKFCTSCRSTLGSSPQDSGAQNATGTAQGRPDVHLKRAWGLMTEVEKATEVFRQRAIQHDAQIDQDEPFVAGLVGTVRSASHLKREKSSLVSDLQLATQEIDRAAILNPDAVLRADSGEFSINALRATVLYLSGQIEMIWGKSWKAQEIFFQCLQTAEFADPHYMLGLLYESEYKPVEALKHFEKCLELDPEGEFSVSALREANAMRNYKKKFRGGWGLFFLMLVFFFPAAIVYFIVKYK